ncbi:MAG TPA: hypothetical protein VMW41_02795 [Candidatus Bathyarchaeia archaeon]|nr:hypothetical protein [Candidatus Bathyarchaeia archaeon]
MANRPFFQAIAQKSSQNPTEWAGKLAKEFGLAPAGMGYLTDALIIEGLLAGIKPEETQRLFAVKAGFMDPTTDPEFSFSQIVVGQSCPEEQIGQKIGRAYLFVRRKIGTQVNLKQEITACFAQDLAMTELLTLERFLLEKTAQGLSGRQIVGLISRYLSETSLVLSQDEINDFFPTVTEVLHFLLRFGRRIKT